MNDNHVTITGNAAKDPELRFTASGQATSTFGLAVNRAWDNKTTGQREEAVSFFNVVVWGQLAENVAESISKGTRVTVTGSLQQRSYEDQGVKKSVIEVNATEVAVSLKWATAQVTRNARDGGEQNNGQQPAARSQKQQAPTKTAPQPTQNFDEEPF